MTPQVQQLYKVLYDKAKSLPNSDALGIMPTHFVGPKSLFKKGLPMFIGRDTYGLGQDKVLLVTDYEYDELNWLKSRDGYYYDDSSFWRVVGHVLERVRGESYGPDVFRDFYWSDLYKINFRAKQGTTQGLRSEQINECAQLLLAEMDDLEPCVSVFLTGIYEGEKKGVGRFFERWEPRGLLKSRNESTGEFTLVGESGKTHRCIVVPHPQGKAQEEIIQKICSLWK
ncbi:MAG: hypothetical protein IKP03_02410 [Fibrobacter sp.]|nr:hypothetical protein [Fibrobacter sp.]